MVTVNAKQAMNINDLKEVISKMQGGINMLVMHLSYLLYSIICASYYTPTPGMQLNKFQIKNESHGFLKDKLTLAYYNFDNGARVDVHLKKRGKR
jgi:hypothetical protein